MFPPTTLAITVWLLPPLVLAGLVAGAAVAYGAVRLVQWNERHWQYNGEEMSQSQSQTRGGRTQSQTQTQGPKGASSSQTDSGEVETVPPPRPAGPWTVHLDPDPNEPPTPTE